MPAQSICDPVDVDIYTYTSVSEVVELVYSWWRRFIIRPTSSTQPTIDEC